MSSTCQICSEKIGADDHYMVTDAVWKNAGMTEGYTHLECLEKCLCRDLTSLDFTLCPLNVESAIVLERCPFLKHYLEFCGFKSQRYCKEIYQDYKGIKKSDKRELKTMTEAEVVEGLRVTSNDMLDIHNIVGHSDTDWLRGAYAALGLAEENFGERF